MGKQAVVQRNSKEAYGPFSEEDARTYARACRRRDPNNRFHVIQVLEPAYAGGDWRERGAPTGNAIVDRMLER